MCSKPSGMMAFLLQKNESSKTSGSVHLIKFDNAEIATIL